PAQNTSRRRGRRWDYLTNIISFPRRCTIILLNTRRTSSPNTRNGNKPITHGERKTLIKRHFSTRDSSAKFPAIFSREFQTFQGTQSWPLAKPAVKYCSPSRKRCRWS